MSIPGFQDWFLPLLHRTADGKPHNLSTLYEQLADDLKLTADDRAQILKSGQYVHENRIGWARTYLKKAGLLESPARGIVQITERGRQTLSQGHAALNVRFLKQFPEFADFYARREPAAAPPDGDAPVASGAADIETPQDTLERVQRVLHEALAEELIDRVKSSPPAFFERLVVDLLVRMGYGGSREDAGQTLGRSGDGGVDGVIREDKLGLDVVYIQAKRWESAVGRPVVQAFAGSLEGVRARKGVLLTTSTFTREAVEYVKNIEKRIVLVDGEQLARLMIQHNVGAFTEATYELKKMDLDYFGES